MPEGDTVFRTCSRLNEALAAQTVLAAQLRWPSLATANLAGMAVTEVVPRAKHILIRFDSGWTLHSHLKMEGQWRIDRSPPRGDAGAAGTVDLERRYPGDDVRAIVVTEPWTAVGLRLGQLDLVRTSEEHTLVGHLGPDILDPEFDRATAVTRLAAGGPTLGAALLDQRNVSGIGTLWASESLFLERLNPWTDPALAEPRVLTGVLERARRLMTANLPAAMQTSTGSRREGENTYVHARSGRPCRRCGTTIRVAPIGPPTRERAMFYCPTCQGGLAPNDPGGRISPLGSGAPARPGYRVTRNRRPG
jgi:endonuclease-8